MHINDVFGNTSFSVSESQLRETNNLSQISKDLLQFSICLKQWIHYKILPSGLCAEICCNRGKKDFQVESGSFQGHIGTLVAIFIKMLKNLKIA